MCSHGLGRLHNDLLAADGLSVRVIHEERAGCCTVVFDLGHELFRGRSVLRCVRNYCPVLLCLARELPCRLEIRLIKAGEYVSTVICLEACLDVLFAFVILHECV